MDIIDRIKLFIKEKGLSVSQFADTCDIPRPTVSQLLNGRNKKVSDEIFRKIHNAYPALSISWLLFGEGEMFKENSLQQDVADPEMDLSINFSDESANISENPIVGELSDRDDVDKNNDSNVLRSVSQNVLNVSGTGVESVGSGVANVAGGRKIVNILVFYSDNSFEYFVPSSLKRK